MSSRVKVKVKRKDPEAIKRLIKNTVRMKGAKVEVGIVRETVRHKKAKMTVTRLAAIHEFGSISANIPARPFIEPTMRENRFKYRKMMWKDAKNISRGLRSPRAALTQIGKEGVDDMKAKILEGNFTPLSAKTIAKKGHSTPLIESGQLYDAIKYKVTIK